MRRRPVIQDRKDEILERCASGRLEVKEVTREDENGLEIKFPAARDHRLVFVPEEDYIDLQKIPFEQCRLLVDYEALWSEAGSFVEALVEGASTGPSSTSFWIRRLSRFFPFDHQVPSDYEEGVNPRLAASQEIEPSRTVTVSLGEATDAFAVMDNLKNMSGVGTNLSRRLTIRIEGLPFVHHDHVQRQLRRIADSFLLQVEQVSGYAFHLASAREAAQSRGLTASPPTEARPVLFPTTEFDQEPMSLYWAGATSSMLIQRFFAFYQVIEYYYPVFARKEAVSTARKLLKDPTFSVYRDSDVGKLVASVQIAGGRGFGDERSQLRATIVECVTAPELRAYIRANGDRLDFFSKKNRYGVIADTNLSLETNDDIGLLNAVADRIYQIRCRIVHTKVTDPTDNGKALLPFSPETKLMVHDTNLVQYVARQVLIASAGPLHM